MRILLTNDDGISAKGLWELYICFSKSHEVAIVAPDREKSAVGHGITLYEPLRASKIKTDNNDHVFAINGTPADCIKLAILELLDAVPDMVISGINPGANVGTNINYSGTVAAAREAALYNIPGIAVSIYSTAPKFYKEAAIYTEMLANNIMENKIPEQTFLNVNIPDLPIKEISETKICRHNVSMIPEYIDKRIDVRKKMYYWHGCRTNNNFGDLNIDEAALNEKYISITPIKCDMTDYNFLESLKTWKFNKIN
jgi:5'-nucleotidase